MQNANVFDFVSYTDFLRVRSSQHLARRNRPLTSEEWAKRLGYRSPQSVSTVLTGKRLPSRELLQKMSQDLGLDSDEARYLELLVFLEKLKRRGQSVKETLTELERLNPRFSERAPIDAATFAYISEWYHVVIKQLAGSASFEEDAEWIRERLRKKVTAAEINGALATLVRLGMLARDADGKLKPTDAGLQTTQDVPSQAIRMHLKQMLERGIEALDEQAPLEREVTALTLRFDPSRMAEAKAKIRSFKDEFDREFESTTAPDVFQLNVQFFSHTNLSKGTAHATQKT